MYSDFSLINNVRNWVSGNIQYGRSSTLIATLFVMLYFSKKQAQSLSVDIETKVLNDLAERMHAQVEILVERPQLIKVLNKVDAE